MKHTQTIMVQVPVEVCAVDAESLTAKGAAAAIELLQYAIKPYTKVHREHRQITAHCDFTKATVAPANV